MTSSELASRTPADQHLVQQIALRDHVDPQDLAALPAHELDRLLPGGRAAFENRPAAAARLRARLGIDPNSPEYQAAAAQARTLLAGVDQQLGSDHAA